MNESPLFPMPCCERGGMTVVVEIVVSSWVASRLGGSGDKARTGFDVHGVSALLFPY
jgi:hypothetical protein